LDGFYDFFLRANFYRRVVKESFNPRNDVVFFGEAQGCEKMMLVIVEMK
jgi:hypothetical protein